MSFMDKAKEALDKATKAAEENIGKAKKAAADHPDKVRGGIDKVGGAVNNATKGKYADKIKTASDKAEQTIQKQAGGTTAETKSAFDSAPQKDPEAPFNPAASPLDDPPSTGNPQTPGSGGI
ncbi:antitoxin [Allobranchiibius sp. CTAmp26]|uniref:antitoxin n=1 Tax=Allobranchiibius sp. CTAmp26 TaxID=2815214 RepID=UPI001FB82DF0|nr:antitoxin [Allobranchiibius sp. CTAmp26]